MGRGTVGQEGIREPLNDVGKGNQAFVGTSPMVVKQGGEEVGIGHELKQVQGGIGQRQTVANIGGERHPCRSAGEKEGRARQQQDMGQRVTQVQRPSKQ